MTGPVVVSVSYFTKSSFEKFLIKNENELCLR